MKIFSVTTAVSTLATHALAVCALFGSVTVALAAGDPAAGQQKSAACAACHNTDGNSVNAEWPKLAGQGAAYTVKQLQNFQAANDPNATALTRVNAVMNGMVASLGEQDMEDLAAYFATQTISPGQADPELLELGEQIYQGGNPDAGIPACAACHGASGAGNPAAKLPQLASQHALYIENQLRAFRSKERANDPNQMMRDVVLRMTDAEIKAVASYIQGLQ